MFIVNYLPATAIAPPELRVPEISASAAQTLEVEALRDGGREAIAPPVSLPRLQFAANRQSVSLDRLAIAPDISSRAIISAEVNASGPPVALAAANQEASTETHSNLAVSISAPPASEGEPTAAEADSDPVAAAEVLPESPEMPVAAPDSEAVDPEITDPEATGLEITNPETIDSESTNPEPTHTETIDTETTAPEAPDDLFEQVFGRPAYPAQQVMVPLFVEQQDVGEVQLLLAPGQPVRVQAEAFLRATANVVRSTIQDQMTAAVDADGNLSLDTLRQLGMDVLFDQRRLELFVQVPPALRLPNVRSLQGQRLPPGAANALPPSRISGYINLRGGQDVIWSGENVNLGRQPLRLNFDGALNIDGWVLEGSTTFIEGTSPAWSRGDVRLVHDDPDRALRYVVGDLALPVTGYQSSMPMAGISVTRNFTLQPYRNTRPVGQFQFFLERPSRVEVLINGRSVQTLQLPAGVQDIRDLPLTGGINDVQLIITDDVGQVQRLNFPASIAGDLLAPGLQQFSYSLGFPSELLPGDRTYSWDRPTLSLAHRWGVSETLTLGGYLQAEPEHQLIGTEGIWATSVGNLGWDVAASHDTQMGSDVAARLRYEYVNFGDANPMQRTLRLAAEYRGDRFLPLGTTEPSDYSLELSAFYSQRLFDGVTGSLSSNYRFGRGDAGDAYSLVLGLSKQFRSGISLNLNLSHGRNTLGQDDQRAYVSLNWLLPERRQSITATAEATTAGEPRSQITWNFSSDRTVESLDGVVELAVSPDASTLSGRLSYTGYRATVDLSHDVRLASDDNSSGHTTRLTFGTALVFADGHFGWSRPVTNSFALVARNPTLRGYTVGVNPGSSGYTAQADRLGPAVVPDLQPYYVSTLNLDAPELPIGYDMGQQSYTLMPSYRSGTLIRVGTDATVFLRGVLTAASGEPIALSAGEIVSLSDGDWPATPFFTNRVGRFAQMGFKPGRYELRLTSHAGAVVQFEIPAGQVGLYDIGNLQLPTLSVSPDN